jgi:tryptophanyl-tRNA synthetase
MSKRILLAGVRPSLTPESYAARVARVVALQNDFRSFVLLADCQAIASGEVTGPDIETAVECTVRYLIDCGFDSHRSICFYNRRFRSCRNCPGF